MKSLIETWLENVAHQPDAFAIKCAEVDLTYIAFERSSKLLAARLRKYRGCDAVVAMPFGPEYFIALHACMRAGVTSLPLDLSLPDEMLKNQLHRLSYTCVISNGNIRTRLGIVSEILSPEDVNESEIPESGVFEDYESDGALLDLPLYRAFTSGSSGQQSLVTVEHRSFANYANLDRDMSVPSRQVEVRCIVGSYVSSMQISVFWRSISQGDTFASIDPRAGGLSASGDQLLRIQPGIISGFPSLLGQVLETVRFHGKLNGTHTLSITGEPLKPSWIISYQDLFPSLETIAYAYSSTEAMLVASWSGSPHEFLAYERIPAGFPDPDKEVLVVDENGLPVPNGETGEIIVRSSFICSALQGIDSGIRLECGDVGSVRTYRTRDVGRFLPNGMIECHGRVDRQCKINGVRIDPLIVEQCIESHQDVESCIVSAIEQNGRTILVAAYVSPEELETDTLRQHMKQSLPLSNQPSVLIWFKSLPKTERGKIALFEVDNMIRERLALSDRFVGYPLVTPTERRLAELWSEMLGTSIVWRNSDFFQMGGHSLAVMQLLDSIKLIWGIRPDISAVFMNSTLADLARIIDSTVEVSPTLVPELPILPVKAWDAGKGRHIFAFVGGAGSEEEFTKYHLIGRALGDAWRVHILPDPQTSKGRFPTIELDMLAEKYARYLIPFCKKEKIWLMGDCNGGKDAFAVASVLQASGYEGTGIILMDTEPPSTLPIQKPIKQKKAATYQSLPARESLIKEALFWLFLKFSSIKAFRSVFHKKPNSQKQLLSMALQYGIFDPVNYQHRFPESGDTAASCFLHYLDIGWPMGEPPSDRFNSYRYSRHVPDFDIDSDEPVLHALLTGFTKRHPRRRLFAYLERPNLKSDLMTARYKIRRECYIPEPFKGEIHLVFSGKAPDDNSNTGWEDCVDGMIHVHCVKGDHKSYLKENLSESAEVIGRILEGKGMDNVEAYQIRHSGAKTMAP